MFVDVLFFLTQVKKVINVMKSKQDDDSHFFFLILKMNENVKHNFPSFPLLSPSTTTI